MTLPLSLILRSFIYAITAKVTKKQLKHIQFMKLMF